VADFPLDLLAPLQQALPPALQVCACMRAHVCVCVLACVCVSVCVCVCMCVCVLDEREGAWLLHAKAPNASPSCSWHARTLATPRPFPDRTRTLPPPLPNDPGRAERSRAQGQPPELCPALHGPRAQDGELAQHVWRVGRAAAGRGGAGRGGRGWCVHTRHPLRPCVRMHACMCICVHASLRACVHVRLYVHPCV